MKRLVYAAGCIISLLCSFHLFAQDKRTPIDIKIDQILSSDYPDIRAYGVITNENKETISNLSPNLFSFTVDSLDIKYKSTITPFYMKKQPIDYTILFSNNGIMDGEPLDFQKNGILQFLEGLEDNDILSLYAVGEEAVPVFEGLQKEAIDMALINGIEVSSVQPRLYDSIINVLRKSERRSIARKVIIVISDGRDQNSRFTKEQLQSVLAEVGIPIYALGIRVLNMQSLSNLNEFADFTGGTYVYSPRISEIPESLKSIVQKITNCYVIDLKIRDLKADNMTHNLELSVTSSDYIGKGKKTFTAVKIPIPKWVKWAAAGVVLFVILVLIVLAIVRRILNRKKMGITKRRCPECRIRQKDSWDSCPFCKYMPELKKKKKKEEKKS